jgi:hypothetical protein
MTEHMPNRRRQWARPAFRGWRLGSLLLAVSALGTALAACAETSGVEVREGRGTGDEITDESEERCGAGGIVCGGNPREPGSVGCCSADNTCSFGRCVPLVTCGANTDCSSDSVCGGASCKPWTDFPQARQFDLSCRNNIDLPSLRPQVQCHWPPAAGPAQFPASLQVISTPMVVDFDLDDNPATSHPSIVFISYAGNLSDVNGVLRVIDGADCRELYSFQDAEHPFLPEVSPALGDIDGDGRPDIVVVDTERNGVSTRTGLAVFSAAGTAFARASRQNSSLTSRIKGISIADVANDNTVPEILTDTGLYAYKDSLSGVVEKVNVEGSALEPPIVHDVDGDQVPELVTATGISNWNPETTNMDPKRARSENLWNQDQDVVGAAFVGMANLGDFRTVLGSDSAEMVIVSNGQLLVTQVDGRVLLRVKGTGIAGGPPVIADFDADGRMEFASPGLDAVTVYDLDCVDDEDVNPDPANCKNPDGPNPQGILWSRRNARGATSGASVFDFDGDRRAEVVYADQCFMRILSGLDGEVMFSVPRSSTTRWDYPVIVDADGDGHSEIVTSSNDNDPTLNCVGADPWNTREAVPFVATHGVTVWADADKRWAGSRPVWNQHTYSVTNVNDNGTIPEMRTIASQFSSPADDPNSLRQNVQGKTGISLELPDVTTSVDPVPKCLQNRAVAQLTVNLCNRGLLTLDSGKVQVAMAQADTNRVLCTLPNTKALRSGVCEEVTCDVPVPSQNPGIDIAVLADPSSAVRECTEGRNNTSLISIVFCQVGPK